MQSTVIVTMAGVDLRSEPQMLCVLGVLTHHISRTPRGGTLANPRNIPGSTNLFHPSYPTYKQEAQLMLTTGSTRLAVNQGQQT